MSLAFFSQRAVVLQLRCQEQHSQLQVMRMATRASL